jgi:hypothetical protein
MPVGLFALFALFAQRHDGGFSRFSRSAAEPVFRFDLFSLFSQRRRFRTAQRGHFPDTLVEEVNSPYPTDSPASSRVVRPPGGGYRASMQRASAVAPRLPPPEVCAPRGETALQESSLSSPRSEERVFLAWVFSQLLYAFYVKH